MDQWVTTTSQFFGYYPKYEYLDNLLSITGRKKINLYIDVKSCAQALFQEWAIRHIINNSKDTNVVDTSLFSAILEFISFHKLYAKKRQIDISFYFFMESGKSTYHLEIHKEYKAHRGLTDMFGLDLASREFFFKILDKNYHVIDRVVNKIPNVCFFKLDYLEADFIPWYLMNRAMSKEDVDSAANVIYSTDKDMLQCLDSTNKFQYYRHFKNTKMISQKEIYEHFLKDNAIKLNDPAEWFPMVLSIMGDMGDGFGGVGGVGPKSIFKNFDYVMTLCGHSMNNVYENIKNNQPIFSPGYNFKNTSLKTIFENQAIIVRNLKLSSFRMISDALDNNFPLYMVEKKKQISETLSNTYKCTGASILINALNKAGLMGVITENTAANLF